MEGEILNTDVKSLQIILLSLLPALINYFIFCYVFFFHRLTRTNLNYATFVLLLGVVQTTDGLMRLSPDAASAYTWLRAGLPIWMFVIPFGVLFTLRFIRWKFRDKGRFMFFILFAPSLLFTLVTSARLDSFIIVRSENWNWISNPQPTPVTLLVFAWITLPSFAMFILLWWNYLRRRRNYNHYMSGLLLAIGFSVPFIAGITTEVLFPLVFGLDDIPLTTPLITIFSVMSLIAIKKYRMLDYSPKHHWEQIITTMNEGLVILNRDGKPVFANKMFYDLSGYESRDLDHLRADQFFSTPFDISLDSINNSKAPQEIQLMRKSGEKIWVLKSCSPYLDSQRNFAGCICIFSNIDYLKTAQERITESELRLSTFINESSMSIHIIDPATHKILFANPAFLKMLQFEPNDLETLGPHDFINHSREDINQRITDVIMNQTLNFGERQWKTKSGKIIHVLVNSFYRKNGDGTEEIYFAAQDISQKVIAEQKLIAAIKELELYIYRTSHDIRSPLASILGLTNIGKMDLKDPVALSYLTQIQQVAGKLDSILSTLVKSMAIKDTDKFNDVIDFPALVTSLSETFKPLIDQAGISVSFEENTHVPFISSRYLIELIFQNILDNAIKYANPATSKKYITISVTENKNTFEIRFADNGIGIDEKLKVKIFDMYFRATEMSKGSGLGLYLVKKAVEKLNGEIAVTSNPNTGTVFSIKIPVRHPAYSLTE